MKHNMSKITFEFCTFQKIHAYTFENFEKLTEIEFINSHFELIDKDAFRMDNSLDHPILELSFKNISMSDSIPLILSNVVLKNWHTDMIRSNANGIIEISNRYFNFTLTKQSMCSKICNRTLFFIFGAASKICGFYLKEACIKSNSSFNYRF